MIRKEYITPKVDVQEMAIVCMLDVSASGSLEDSGIGGSGSGMDADTNIRNEWDEGLW